jgi:AraC-like DNA-binding protein
VQHVEFFHIDHFEHRYHRRKAKKSLWPFIDYFWETDFESLWAQYPEGFSDALFPNIGYTYLINLGTPFVMQLEETRHEIRSDGFLPRFKNMVCHHSVDNRIFGVKFNVSPIVFEKKVNFFEYREFIYPLAYLIDTSIVQKVKQADSFNKRVEIISHYYDKIIEKHAGTLNYVHVVANCLQTFEASQFQISIEALADQNKVSTRTLQRYFEAATSINTKQALQLMRIRNAVEQLVHHPGSFQYIDFGYYDYSHFYKHLKAFLNSHTTAIVQPHLQLLKRTVHTP